ncbi:hypothetical protein HOD30_04985 [Candidatus Peregrinibacteria bacterium]|jgi:hypothetical protein|nr:hypothetical protein [Candidatus Peregrinibacteria bacterium]MBT4631379.1 hypothetical protein [Candidatus Peregrinibacteria bacterium]
MNTETLLSIITVVPALAWFVTAFVNLYKLYNKNKIKIKETVIEKKEQVIEKAEEIKETIEKKVEEKKAEKEETPQTQSDEHTQT